MKNIFAIVSAAALVMAISACSGGLSTAYGPAYTAGTVLQYKNNMAEKQTTPPAYTAGVVREYTNTMAEKQTTPPAYTAGVVREYINLRAQ